MNHKVYIVQFLKRARRRLSLAVLVDVMIKALAAGFGAGAVIHIAALLFPIYGAFGISWIALSIVLLIGLVYAVMHFPDYRKTALEIDSKGLKERLTTFVEMEKTGMSPEWRELQTEDTYQAVVDFDLKEKAPIRVEKKPMYFLTAMVALFIVAAVLPSPNKELAIAIHEQKEKAEAEIEKIEEAEEKLEELAEMEHLTEAELAEIQKMQDILEKAKEELAEAKTQEELEKAIERLETKTLQNLSEQKQTSSQNKASEMKKKLEEFLKKADNQSKEEFSSEELKDILDAKDLEELKEALAKELEELMGELSEEELEELMEQLEQLEELEGSLKEGSLTKEQLEQLLEALQNGTLSGAVANQMAQIMDGTLGISIPSNQSASNQNGQSGNGNGSGSGNGNGNGSGNGSGNGNGQGSGNGSGAGHGGSGIGGGQNYGSKNGIEKENNRMDHDEQVTIPGREIGDDENLTGQSGEGDSYQTVGGEGLTWSGEKVNYDQVVGEYTEEAYARIENNEVPKGMEDVVKSYFEGINQ